MSTLSIIVLSVLAAIFALILIAAVSALVYVYFLVRRQIVQFSLTVDDTKSKLDSQFSRIESLIGTIHGDRIEKAAQEFLQQIPRQAQLVTRIEQAVLLFKDLVVHVSGEAEISGSAIDRARASGLGPDSYAPAAPGEHYVSRSRVASADAESLADEAAENSQSFDGA